ncbi:hypothetical protein D3C75_669840 [compost metagenome]
MELQNIGKYGQPGFRGHLLEPFPGPGILPAHTFRVVPFKNHCKSPADFLCSQQMHQMGMGQIPVDRHGGLQSRNSVLRLSVIPHRRRPGKLHEQPFPVLFHAKADIPGVLIIKNLEHPPVSADERQVKRSLQPVRQAVQLLDAGFA